MGIDPEQQWGKVDINESLVGRKAGTGASEKARELRHQAPAKAVLSRILGVHTEERAWNKGSLGEKMAGFWLSRLPAEWHILHDVPVGERGTNIDHLAIGPGGVYTINTKHLSGKVVVLSRTICVNGHMRDFLPLATHEARRASRLLTAAVGRDVMASSILAFAVDELQIKQPPQGVTVLRVAALRRWLVSRPAILTRAEAIAIAGAAHKPSTWVSPPGGSMNWRRISPRN